MRMAGGQSDGAADCCAGCAAMCWEAEPTQLSTTSLERCTIAPRASQSCCACVCTRSRTPLVACGLCSFFSPLTRPRRMSLTARAQAPCSVFRSSLYRHIARSASLFPSATTGTCSTCSVACDVRGITAGSAHRRRRAGKAAALAGLTRRHPGAASAAMHEHIFRLRAPMANLPVHPPRTADYQGHAAGGGKKGTERSDAGSSSATRGL
jgi:hypothetical protein